MPKNLDETVRLQSEKREEWLREIRGKRLQVIAVGTSSAPRLTNSSAALLPGRNEYLGTLCSLTVQEKREDKSAREIEVKGKMEEKTRWRGQSERQRGREGRRSGRLVDAAEISGVLAEWHRLHRKNLNILGLLKKRG